MTAGSRAERAYEAERRKLFRHRTNLASLLVILLVPLFGIADYFMFRPQFAPLMGARLLSAVMSSAIFLLLRTRLGRRRPSWLAIALVVESAFAVAFFPVYLTGTTTQHYVSVALLILTAAALLPWRTAQVVLLSLILTAAFTLAALLHGLVSPGALGAQVSAIVTSGFLAVMSTILAEEMRVREFRARRELGNASSEKSRLIHGLETMATRLATANEDLQERQRETDDFLYVLSHDLRAPLINIQGFGKRLQTDMTALEPGPTTTVSEDVARGFDRMKQSLQFISAGTAKIDQLISRLLDIARLTTRPGQHQSVDTGALVRDVVDACRFQLETSSVEVTVGELPSVHADPVQLNQVFTNLVDNAIKYMGERPCKQLTITCAADPDRHRFAVQDTGPGIDAKDRDKVFRLFARLAPPTTSGEGIGLATVRAIVNRHGGRIWVEPTPGGGSTFYFTLPRATAEAGTNGSALNQLNHSEQIRREEHSFHAE